MAQAQELIDLNNQVTETVTNPNQVIDDYAAELLLRNVAVATDRLEPNEFSRLTTETVDSVLDVASIAKAVAPLEDIEMRKFPKESEAQYKYRTVISDQLHAFQRKLALDKVEHMKPEEQAKVRSGIKLAGKAFAGIMEDAADNPRIKETERYFKGNTSAAAIRVARKNQ